MSAVERYGLNRCTGQVRSIGGRGRADGARFAVASVPGNSRLLVVESEPVYRVSLTTNVAPSSLLELTDPNVEAQARRFVAWVDLGSSMDHGARRRAVPQPFFAK